MPSRRGAVNCEIAAVKGKNRIDILALGEINERRVGELAAYAAVAREKSSKWFRCRPVHLKNGQKLAIEQSEKSIDAVVLLSQ